jgi:hypothetical protein
MLASGVTRKALKALSARNGAFGQSPYVDIKKETVKDKIKLGRIQSPAD